MQECRSNKRERFSRVPRLSDTRYSAKGVAGRWRYASSKATVFEIAVVLPMGAIGYSCDSFKTEILDCVKTDRRTDSSTRDD